MNIDLKVLEEAIRIKELYHSTLNTDDLDKYYTDQIILLAAAKAYLEEHKEKPKT